MVCDFWAISPQLLQSLEFQHLYNSLIVKVSNLRRVADFCKQV